MYKKVLIIGVVVLLLLTVFHPERHAKYYRFIPKYDIFNELVENNEVSNLKPCVYKDVILNSEEVHLSNIYEKHNYTPPLKGGEYVPRICRSLYKTAIIIPYRKRKEQLNIFIDYMHAFLQKQNLHYKVFVVDQQDDAPFNRGKNLNIGSAEAINDGFPCLVLHDVDLIPVASGNLYACSKQPRHMSSCVDTFRYQVPYRELFGGAVAMTSDDFTRVNGYSNQYAGWGGEDDDLYRRLKAHNLTTCRFAPELSRYLMLKHKKAKPSENRYNLLNKALQRQRSDGINSLGVQYSVIQESLYTHIIYT